MLCTAVLTIILSTLFLGLNVHATQPQQQALSTGPSNATYGDENVFDFSAFGSLDALSEDVYTSLKHPFVPGYGLRVKKSGVCDGMVNAYTGYIDIAARHLFFYFFESRREPSTDDVIFWTNGGPGCSSSVGCSWRTPCRVTGANETTFHPYSWNEVANIFFIDQPIGTGFSYAEYGEYVSTTEEAARDIGAFMLLFFEHFTSFKGRAFHMAGESYGCRAVPTYAAYIVDQNKRLAEVGVEPINLKSIILANGCTDVSVMLPSLYNASCEHHFAPPLIDISCTFDILNSAPSTCVALKRMLPRCKTWLQEACYDTTDAISCKAAYDFCAQLATAYEETGYNPFDITKKCDGDYGDNPCYPTKRHISAYLSQPSIQQKLGVDQYLGKPERFVGCNLDVVQRFRAALDNIFPVEVYIEQLLERGVKVLVYAGDVDWVCNWIGNERMTTKLSWHGQEEFASQPLRGWNVTSDSGDLRTYEAGLTRSAGSLTFATVHGGGHMTPYDQPLESLELIKRWLAGEEL